MLRPTITCSDCEETRPHAARGLCNRCYKRRQTARIEMPPTFMGVNKVVELADGTYEMILTDRRGAEKGRTKIDASSISKLRSFGVRWCLDNQGRVHTATGGRTISLSRFLMDEPSGLEVDHEDGDPLNNTLSNLREVTHAQNCQNVGTYSKSGHRNVSLMRNGRYSVSVKGKYYGCFKGLEDAVEEARSVRARVFTHHNEERH